MKCQVKGCKEEGKWVGMGGEVVCSNHFAEVKVISKREDIPIWLLPLMGEAESLTLVYII